MTTLTEETVTLEELLAWEGQPLEIITERSADGEWRVQAAGRGEKNAGLGTQKALRRRLTDMLRHYPQQCTVDGAPVDTRPLPETGHATWTTYGGDRAQETVTSLTSHLMVDGKRADAHVAGVLWSHPQLEQKTTEIWIEDEGQTGRSRNVSKLTVQNVPSIALEAALAMIAGPEHPGYPEAKKTVESQTSWMTHLAEAVHSERPQTERTIYARQRIGDAQELKERKGIIPCTVYGTPVTIRGLPNEQTVTASIIAGLEEAFPTLAPIAGIIRLGMEHERLTKASYHMDDEDDVTKVTLELKHPPGDGMPETIEGVIPLIAGGTWPDSQLVTMAPGAGLQEEEIMRRLAVIYARDAQRAAKNNAAAIASFAEWTKNEARPPDAGAGDEKINWSVPDDADAASRLTEAITGEAKRQTAAELESRDYLAYREHSGRRILTIASRRQGRPALAISAAEDGTLNLSQNGSEIDGKPEMARHEIDGAIQAWIAGLITHRALAMTAEEGITAVALQDDELQRKLENAARDVFHGLSERKDVPKWILDPIGGDRNLDPASITGRYITRPEIWQLLKRANIEPRTATVRQYNRAVRNAGALKAMEEQNPAVAHFYLNTFQDDGQAGGPEEIEARVRTSTQLTGTRWTTFQKVPWEAWQNSTSGIHHNLERVCAVLELVDPALLGEPGINEAVKLLSQYNTNSTVPWRHGDSRTPWANLVEEHLKESTHWIMSASSNRTTILNSLADAIRNTIAQARPWPPATWQELRERADRWDRESVERREEIRAAADAAAPWPSTLGPLAIGNRTYTPAVDAETLANLGETLGNCLADYAPACREGTTIIFAASEDGAITGAVELALTPAGWQRGQTEGPENGDPPEGMEEEGNTLAALYQEGEDQKQLETAA